MPTEKHSSEDEDDDATARGQLSQTGGNSTPVRKPPQKWTAMEKRIFKETLEKHGRNWDMLEKAVGTKNINQIKNFYYDNKKGKKSGRSEATPKSSKSSESGTKEPRGTKSKNNSTGRKSGKGKNAASKLEEEGTKDQLERSESDGEVSGIASIPESLPASTENAIPTFNAQQQQTAEALAQQYDLSNQEASNEILQHLMAHHHQQQQQSHSQHLLQQLQQHQQQQQQQQHLSLIHI